MKNGKLAHQIARAIERQIARRQYRNGEKLGTEAGFAQYHKVSRSVVREALALVEQSGLAYNRRGRGGGLIFGAMSAENIAANLERYLDFISRDYKEAVALRRVVEGFTARLACQRLDAAGLVEMEEMLAEHAAAKTPEDLIVFTAGMVRKMQVAAKNPMLQVVSLLVGRQTFRHLSSLPAGRDGFIERVVPYAELRKRLIGAVIGADIGAGWNLVSQSMDVFDEVISASAEGSQVIDDEQRSDSALLLKLYGVSEGAGLVPSVVGAIRSRIIKEQLGEGDMLGSEASLTAELGVGRGVLRSAVRLLEQLSVVRMTTGKNGGLQVLTPNPRSIIDRSTLHLQSIGVTWGHIEELTEVLAPFALEGAIRTAAPDERARIAALFEEFYGLEGAKMRHFAMLYHDLLARISAVSSPTLSFIFSLMGNTISRCESRELDGARVSSVNRAGFEPLQAAILEGDVDMARRRLISLTKSGFRFVVAHT